MSGKEYEGLVKSTEKHSLDVDSKEQFEGYFKKDIQLPLWSVGQGEHIIDIIPFFVGPNNPAVVKKEMVEGDPDYVLDVWVHQHIGPNSNTYICPNKTFGRSCPICEHVKELRMGEDPDFEIIDDIKAKRRSVYNVVVYDTPEEEKKGVQIWEVAHFNFQQKIAPLAKQNPRGGGAIIFAHPKTGASISFERTGTGKLNTKYEAHRFLAREVDGKPYVISEEILNSAIVLDDIIEVLSYEQLFEIHFGGAKKLHESGVATNPLPRRESATKSESATSDASDKECPAGGKFGRDFDKFQDCQDCKLFEDCANLSDNAEAQKELPEKEEKKDEKPKGRRVI